MSDNITKRVGLGTAYGFAKAGGYEGTVAEFTELLGNIAIDLARIENLSVTVTTLPAGSQATASLNGSVLSLGIPKGDKGDKGNTGDTGAPAGFGTVSATVDANIGTPSVEVTASGADTAKNFAFAFHNLKGQKGDKGDTGEVSEAELTQAFVDFSENGTVANAEQLVSNVRVNDKTPYLFRTSGGSVDIGDREYVNGIIGGTVAWNQLVPESWRTSSASSVPFVAGTAITKGHKYLMWGNRTDNSKQTFAYIYVRGADSNIPLTLLNLPASGVLSNGVVFNASENGLSDGTANWDEGNIWIYQGAGSSYIKFENLELFDLTQMFGSTIADYIYSLETATAGAGVAWFKKLFPKPYYAYNAGELMSVKGLVSHDMTGFNQWDEEWEVGSISTDTGTNTTDSTRIRAKNYSKCVPNTSYFVECSVGIRMFFYDADKNFISSEWDNNGAFTTPTNATFFRFITQTTYGTTYNHDICINISWDGSRNGEYEPYDKHSYPLDSDLTLRGIPKLDANNNLYYDGDTYEPDGTVTRKYRTVTFNGSENWVKEGSTWNTQGLSVFYLSFGSDSAIYGRIESDNSIPLLISTKWKAMSVYDARRTSETEGATLTRDSQSVNYAKYIEVTSSLADVTAWKASLQANPVTVVYELATPTTETADPYVGTQIVNDFGTEEYVLSDGTFAVPVGHDTDYPINLVAKLEMAPNSPEGNGDYIVRQTNGMNEYVPLVIEDALPTIPSIAGTYKLTVTVADGVDPVLSWEAE